MEKTQMDTITSKCQSIKIIPSLEDTLITMGLNIVLDDNAQAWLDQLKLIWGTWRRSANMESRIEDLFRFRNEDAFRIALVFVIKCEEYKDSKPKSLPYFLIEILLKYSKACNIFAEDSLKMPAFHIAVYQRNQHFLSLMVKAYQIITIKESIVPIVKDMIKNENVKQASQIVIAMELFDDIPVEDLLFPLVLLDKPNMIDDYLSEAPSQITAFLLFLDKLLHKNFKMLDFVQDYAEQNNIGHVKYEKLHYKPLGKLVARLCNKFNIPVETCKNLSNNRTASGLRYLVYRKYIEHNITTSVWEDLVKDSLRQNSESVHSFLDLLIDHDKAEAMKWAKYLNLPETKLPLALRGTFLEEPPEENWDTGTEVNNQNFYESPLTREQINIIETGDQFYDLISVIKQTDIVSLDCEWKPSFGAKQCQVALIQLGTKDMVYLIDTILLNKPEYASFWYSFYKSFLENAEIIKLGFGLEQDLREMKASIVGLSNIKVKGEGFLDLSILWRILVDNELSLPDCSDKGASLSALVQTCFGNPLEKSEQCSNWELRPLRETQIKYAAIDADVLIKIYYYLQNRSQQQGINFEAICNCIMDESNKKTVKKPKTANNPPLSATCEAKSPADVKILVDMKLTNIMSYLRYCGIDTISRASSMLWHDVINLASSSDRLVVVTKPKNTPNNNFPQSSILSVGIGPIAEQLHKILTTYNINTQQKDLMTICLYCNSKDLRKLNTDQVQKICTAYEAASNESLSIRYVGDVDDNDVDFGNFLSDSEGDDDHPQYPTQSTVTVNQTCKTSKGVRIVVDDAAKLCSSKKPAILCEDCGRLCTDDDTVLKAVGETVLKVTKLAEPTWL